VEMTNVMTLNQNKVNLYLWLITRIAEITWAQILALNRKTNTTDIPD